MWEGQVQLHLQIHICVVPLDGPLHLWLHSHIYLTLDDGGVNSRSRSISSSVYLNIICSTFTKVIFFFYFSSAILIALNDDLELIVLCRLRTFSKMKLISVPTHY